MDLTSYAVCVLLAGASGGAAGWCTVRRMLGGAPRSGGTMRGWPGPGRSHGGGADASARRLGRAPRPGRWWRR